MTQIVRSFGAEWKRSIEAINSEILQSFTNLKNGTNILQVMMYNIRLYENYSPSSLPAVNYKYAHQECLILNNVKKKI